MIALSRGPWSVEIDPSRGGGITSLRGPKGEVLYRAEGLGRRLTNPSFERTRREWLSEYSGGWDEILPNPGEASVWSGHRVGFHGDTAVRPATVAAGPRGALVRVDSITGLVLERQVVLLENGIRVESAVHHAGGHAVPWLQHPVFAVAHNSVVETGDDRIDSMLGAALSSDRPDGFWCADSPDEVSIGTMKIRWSKTTWPLYWLWVGTDEDRRFLGVEPASCAPDRTVIARQDDDILTGWMEVRQE